MGPTELKMQLTTHYCKVKLDMYADNIQVFHIQGVFEVEAFLLTCDSIRCSKEF
jgi:hypothetical protein